MTQASHGWPAPPTPVGEPTISRSYGPASGRATLAMWLGIVSWVCLLGFLTGVPAAILGRVEMSAIDEGRAPEAGRTRATIGMVSGLLSTVVTCLGCGIYLTALGLHLGQG